MKLQKKHEQWQFLKNQYNRVGKLLNKLQATTYYKIYFVNEGSTSKNLCQLQ